MSSATIVGVVIAYLLVLLAIGIWGGRESESMIGYYVAGKKLPSWVIAFSSNATGESGWLLLGLTGMAYLVGVHALWVVLGEVLGVALAWTLVALPFKRATDECGAITVADFLEARFEDKDHVIRLVSAVIILSMVTTYVVGQMTALGKAFSSFLGVTYVMGVLIGTVVIIFYTSVGGFKAVAYSDLLQGILMLGGLILLPWAAVGAAGGWIPMWERLHALDPALVEPMGRFGLSAEGVCSVLSFLGIGFAFLGAPQLLTRFISARDETEIARGGVLASFCMVVFDTGAVFTGIAGRVLFPNLGDAETIMPTLSGALFSALVAGIFLVIVLAAIMSTVDSLLILASSAVVRDVMQKTYRSSLSEAGLASYGKRVTVLIGITALVMALAETRAIFWFILFAWSGLASAFAPVVLCALFWKGATREGAVAGMTGGFLTTLLWVVFAKEHFYDLYEMIPGFVVGFFLIIAVSLIRKSSASTQALQGGQAGSREWGSL